MFEEFACLLMEREERASSARNEGAQTLLGQWMKESEILELKAFAAMLSQDMDAIEAAMVTLRGQGLTEYRVNKLKPIKHSMYWLAEVDLLRQRVMYASAA